MLEIERKFIISSPEIDKIIHTASATLFMAQWYISAESEFRIRMVVFGNGEIKWIKTVKRGEGLIREENEKEINPSEVDYEKLRVSPCVVKSRYVFPSANYEGVIDRYFYPDIGYIGEIEMKNGASQELMPSPLDIWNLNEIDFKDVTGVRKLTARSVSKLMEVNELNRLIGIIEKRTGFTLSQRQIFTRELLDIYEQ